MALKDKRVYHAKIHAALGDGSEWDYTGQCYEDEKAEGECVCGKTGIRFLFAVQNVRTKETAWLGSCCINYFPGVSEDVKIRVDEDRRRLARGARERRRCVELGRWIAKLDAEYQALVATYRKRLLDHIGRYRNTGTKIAAIRQAIAESERALRMDEQPPAAKDNLLVALHSTLWEEERLARLGEQRIAAERRLNSLNAAIDQARKRYFGIIRPENR